MAIYRIFPEKDSFITSEEPFGNTGLDEIVEVGGYKGYINGKGQTARIITKYSDEDIDNVINNKIGMESTGSMNVSLKMYLADASALPTDYTLYAYPVFTQGTGDWDTGTGKFGDIPINETGVSWYYKNDGRSNTWTSTGFPAGVTASYQSGLEGGGSWYTEYNGTSMEFNQNHLMYSSHDVDINVTPAVKEFYDNTLVNDGFILKIQDEYEFYESGSIRLKYFGKDTNTIYPPFMEFKWDDSTYNTGSLGILGTDVATVSINNLKDRYADEGKQRFRISAKPTYPERRFTTSSVYLDNYALPSASYWGLRDENTEEMVVDFDTEYTKVSCDGKGGYFDVYMDGLQPERYYRILIKTTLNESDAVIDNNNIFKVVRNG